MLAGAGFAEELDEVENPISAPVAMVDVVLQIPSTALEGADAVDDGSSTLVIKRSVRICGRTRSYSLFSIIFLALLILAILAANQSGVGSAGSNIEQPTMQTTSSIASLPTDNRRCHLVCCQYQGRCQKFTNSQIH